MRYAFEDYVIDSDRRELTRSAQPIAVGPQIFDLLLHLVRNREHVVSKDELLDVVWAGRIVSESTLTSHINAARKAIGDSGQKQRLLRTIARKGFRFVGDVSEIATRAASVSTDTHAAGEGHRRGAGPPRRALDRRAPVPEPKRRHRSRSTSPTAWWRTSSRPCRAFAGCS